MEKDNEENDLFGENGDIGPSSKVTDKESFEKKYKKNQRRNQGLWKPWKTECTKFKNIKKGFGR